MLSRSEGTLWQKAWSTTPGLYYPWYYSTSAASTADSVACCLYGSLQEAAVELVGQVWHSTIKLIGGTANSAINRGTSSTASDHRHSEQRSQRNQHIGTTSSGAVVGLGEIGDFPTIKQGAKALGDSTINRSGGSETINKGRSGDDKVHGESSTVTIGAATIGGSTIGADQPSTIG